jgi:hypothetical protein
MGRSAGCDRFFITEYSEERLFFFGGWVRAIVPCYTNGMICGVTGHEIVGTGKGNTAPKVARNFARTTVLLAKSLWRSFE